VEKKSNEISLVIVSEREKNYRIIITLSRFNILELDSQRKLKPCKYWHYYYWASKRKLKWRTTFKV